MVAKILALFLPLCVCFDIPRWPCNPGDVEIDNVYYNLTDTYTVDRSYITDAHYDIYGNLFYVNSGRNCEGFYYDVFMLKAGRKTPIKVDGLPPKRSYSVAIDKKNSDVYFGTGDGIYKFDYGTSTASLKMNIKVEMIFIDKDGNQFVTESRDGLEELYLLDGERKIRFNALEALNELTIDDQNNFYFIKAEQLFVLKTHSIVPTAICNVKYYNGIAQIEVYKDKVFIASQKLSYLHYNDSGNEVIVNNVPDKVSAIAFDSRGNFAVGTLGKLLFYRQNYCYYHQ